MGHSMFAGYTDELLVGAGGLGRVYRATKVSTGGDVAIKELTDVAAGSPAWHRARREVDALLRLKGHPHVISVEEMIEGPNGPCIVMEFAPGGSLMDRVATGPLPLAELVLVGQQVSLALAAAHEVGIVHRDVKPHNLLVASFGQVKVCDFGIAAVARGDSSRTQTQALTLAYASPEELDGVVVVGPPADVYSFAATMQHLASGLKPSFQDRMSGETGAIGWPDAAEAVMGPVSDAMRRAMAHRPGDRPTMDELGTVFDAASLELGPSRLRRLPDRVTPPAADDATVVRPARWPNSVGERASTDRAIDAGGSSRRTSDSGSSASRVFDAVVPLGATVVRRHASETRKRKVVPAPRHSLLIQSAADVFSAAFDPAGVRIVTADAGESAVIWDASTGEPLIALSGHRGSVFSAAFSPDGLVVVTAGEDGRVIFWEVSTGERLAELAGHRGGAYSAAFSPDGRAVVSDGADGQARLWEAASSKLLCTFSGHIGDAFAAAFSPDGRIIVTVGPDGGAIVWDSGSGLAVAFLTAHKGELHSAAFDPQGSRIVTAGADGRVVVWAVTSGQQVMTMAPHRGEVLSAVFSPNGDRVAAACSDGSAVVWKADTGDEVETLVCHRNGVQSASFSPDGRRLLTVGTDGSVGIWGLR